MGFDTLYNLLLSLQTSNELCSSQVDTAKRIAANMPAFMASLRGTYDAAGIQQAFMNKHVKILMKKLATYPYREGPKTPMRPLIHHVVDKVCLHVHHSDATCRKWASICAELKQDKDALELLCVLSDEHDEFHNVIRVSLSYVVSECNRVGAHTMPLPS